MKPALVVFVAAFLALALGHQVVDETVQDRGLITESITPEQIIANADLVSRDALDASNHARIELDVRVPPPRGQEPADDADTPTTKPQMVLGYVTPWNSHGYDVAKQFTHKFTHISPVWYQVRIVANAQDSSRLKVELAGAHDVDEEWVATVQGNGAKLVPRFLFEIDAPMFLKLAGSKKLQARVIKVVRREVLRRGFDGVVLEMTSAWPVVAQNKPGRRKKLNRFVVRFAEDLHDDEKEVILVVAPPHSASQFAADDFAEVGDAVDGLSFMTYDHSSSANPGPSAPLPWMRSRMQGLMGPHSYYNRALRAKIMLGLNFYGQDFAGGKARALLGRDFVQILRDVKPDKLEWNDEWKEHYVEFSDFDAEGNQRKHQVFYPTYKSLSERLDFARREGLSISIWEIGQGLDSWMDLF